MRKGAREEEKFSNFILRMIKNRNGDNEKKSSLCNMTYA